MDTILEVVQRSRHGILSGQRNKMSTVSKKFLKKRQGVNKYQNKKQKLQFQQKMKEKERKEQKKEKKRNKKKTC